MWYLWSWRDLRRRSNAGHGLLNKPEITPPSHSNHHRAGTKFAVRAYNRDTDFGAQLVAKDAAVDLAVLKTSQQAPRVAPVRGAVRLGEPVAAFGSPHVGVLSRGGNFT